MTDKVARIHTHTSNRAKTRETSDRKAVFKSVLDNPFRISWPSVPSNLQNSILAMLIKLLDGVASFQQQHRAIIRKRKRENKRDEPLKKRKCSASEKFMAAPVTEEEEDVAQSNDPPCGTLTRPPILNHISVGINEVTKRLEDQNKVARLRAITAEGASTPSETKNTPFKTLKVVFVCRADINPHLLIDHFPHLVAAYNSSQAQETLKLVSLPKDAEGAIANGLGLQRAAVIGLHAECPELQSLLPLLENVPTLKARWLAPSVPTSLVPTHVKQVKTSTPRDMRAAKEKRKEGRAEAKQRQKEKLKHV